MTTAIRTTCPYCGVGCGVIAATEKSGAVVVRGDPDHPANRGRLCSKGTQLAATLDTTDRLLYPQVNGQRVTWDIAVKAVADGLSETIDRHGPESVALYVSGQLLTEDYYVANKLMKGYVGTANIDTNSRLCMASAVAGHVRSFGEDIVPVDYTDLDVADLVVLVGSNLAWCHPVLMQRLQALREQRPQLRIVAIDPRRTATTEIADLHLPLRSGTDVMLFNGLLVWLAQSGCNDRDFVAAHTEGLDAALAAAGAASADVAATAQACGVDAGRLQQFFDWFGSTPRVITLFSQGVNQSSAGVDKVNSIINCHLFTGRIGRDGAGPFSITGQPNAMGGREVGGLATQLAAHLDIGNAEHRSAVQEFWKSPRIAARPGLKAVELFDAIHAGTVKAVWIMATNPVVSLPDADAVVRALRKCPLVIVSDCVASNDTLPFAHIRLPASAWGEKEGTVTNSDRHISRQRAFLAPPGEARADWWALCRVAQRMGFDGFEFESPAEIFSEHARLSSAAVRFGRQFDLRGLGDLSPQDYAELTPRQWPVAPAGTSAPKMFRDGRFPTPSGRARFVAVAARAPRNATTAEFPLVLNTGRMRDQWHTMTRTARAPLLNAHEPFPYAEVHGEDLAASGLRSGQLTRVTTRWGSSWARVRSSADVPAGMVFMPIHFSDQFARHARVGAVVNPVVDPLSGEPEFKHTPARLEPVSVEWQGFLISRRPIGAAPGLWWARSPGQESWRLEFAGSGPHCPDGMWLRQMLDVDAEAQWIEFEDAARGVYRAAVVIAGRLEACLMVARDQSLPARGWLQSLFGESSLTALDRRSLLRGARDDRPDPGHTVCACFGVGSTALQAAMHSGCTTLEAIGRQTRAGTNCGSCRPEIARMLA